MAENDIKKTIDVTVQATKMTSEVLKGALSEFLNGKTQSSGQTSLRKLNKQAQGKLDNIAITENNISDFKNVAAKYDVNYALKRDKSTSPPTYHVFFQSSKTDNFQKAFKEYAGVKSKQIEKDKSLFSVDKLKHQAKEISKKPKQKVREKSKEQSL
ncbi:MAG: PcfB family protein [Ruminococcus sp.]|nr:PcfB family protein [Ruminococcus sp.]